MSLKHHKIFTHDHINARELSEVYMSDSGDHGRLFIILELPKHKIDQQPFIDEIINQTSTYFDTAIQENPETLLEEILQQLNQLLPDLASSIKIRGWLNNLDLTVGIIQDDNVFLASIGNINGLLIHNNQLTPILSKEDNINPTKVFSDIVSGQLDEGDVLMISTDALFDYISKEKVKQIVKKYAPSAAAIKINELLETVPDFVTFNSLIIKKPGSVDVEIKPEEIKHDMEQGTLDYEEEKPELPKTDKTSASRPRTKTVLDVKAVKNIDSVKKAGNILSLIKLFFVMVKNFFVYIGRKVKEAVLFVFSPRHRKQKEDKALEGIRDVTEKKYSSWQGLSTKKKVALGVLILLVLVFFQGLVFLTQKKADEQKNADYNNALLVIKNKYEEVDARLIYNDEEAAEELMLEIDQILDELQANTPEQQTTIDEMKDTLFHKLNKIRHIHVVPSPLELFNMNDIVLSAKQIVQKDGNFYILADNKIYQLNDSNLELIYDIGTGEEETHLMTDWPNENKLILGDLNVYSIFDIDSKEIVGTLDSNEANTSIADLAVYGNNLYVLDPTNNQVFKYPEQGTGFGGGQTWLQEEVDLSNVSSFTIDGSIYTVGNDGEIKNFLKGAQEEFDYHKPRPVIGSGSIIKTFRDSDYLYIIDPSNQRIVILDKEGNIKDQYTSQAFDDLNDLAVDPEEKAIYLLNGNYIYLLAINE